MEGGIGNGMAKTSNAWNKGHRSKLPGISKGIFGTYVAASGGEWTRAKRFNTKRFLLKFRPP